MKKISAVVLAAVALGGCGALYTNVRYPLSYRSATPSDIKAGKTDKIATGEACNQSVLFMVAWGDGGYVAAVKDALKDEPAAVLYDVKTDIKGQSVLLGLYSRVCTLVSGKIAYP